MLSAHDEPAAIHQEHALLFALFESISAIHAQQANATLSTPQRLLKEPWVRTRAWHRRSHIGTRQTQARYYYDLVRSLAPRQVCEIGFNGGHSSALYMAAAGPQATLVSFDLFVYSYSPRAQALLDYVFPKQLSIVRGNSVMTVPQYAQANLSKRGPCDFFSIDGGHNYYSVRHDLRNALRVTRPGGTVIVDDAYKRKGFGVETAWNEFVGAGCVVNVTCSEIVVENVPWSHRFDTDPAHHYHVTNKWCHGRVPYAPMGPGC